MRVSCTGASAGDGIRRQRKAKPKAKSQKPKAKRVLHHEPFWLMAFGFCLSACLPSAELGADLEDAAGGLLAAADQDLGAHALAGDTQLQLVADAHLDGPVQLQGDAVPREVDRHRRD